MNTGLLLVRADGGPSLGRGHVMRCLALAQAWQDAGGAALFVSARPPDDFVARLAAEGFELVEAAGRPGSDDDAQSTARVAGERKADWTVVDGYHFGAPYQRRLKEQGLDLLVLDDAGHCEHYHADLVLNPNLHAGAGSYGSRDARTRLLLGPRFAPLRREFWPWSDRERDHPARARRLLLTLGGGDQHDLLRKVMGHLASLADEELEVVVLGGDSVAGRADLAEAAARLSCRARVEFDVRDVTAVMAGADLAVSAAGSTCWELALTGLPFLALAVADNQRPVERSLAEAGAAVGLGWHGELSGPRLCEEIRRCARSASARRSLAQRARGLVDGEGGRRVVLQMTGEPLRLRDAETRDCKMLWEWANEPEVRVSSFSSEPIPWERHQRWFRRKLDDPGSCIYIAIDPDDRPVGQVRFDSKDAEAAELSVSIAPGRRGSGLGSRLIAAGTARYFRLSRAGTIHALIKTANAASVRAFEKAGFTTLGPESVAGHEALRLVKRRPTLVHGGAS